MLSCKCLNIAINNQSPDIEKVDYNSLQLSDIERNDCFFKQEIGKVYLGSISKEQGSLVHTRVVGNWIVHQCWNCGLFTHAVHKDKGASNVLVNTKLLVNASEIAALRKSDRFSTAFRIVIIHTDSDLDLIKPLDEVASVARRPTVTGNLALGGLQQQLNEAVRLETQLTEDRVRKFTEDQYALLDSFRERSRRDHRTLARLVIANQATQCGESIDGDQSIGVRRLETPPSTVDMYSSAPMPISHSKHVNKPKHTLVNSLSSHAKRSSSGRHSSSKLTNSVRSESYDSEVLFPLDGMDDSPSANRNHSDIESDTDDSLSHDDTFQSPRQRAYSANLAKSLPMNVPAFMSPYSRNAVDVDDEQAPEDPLDIAASIKALARSVHGDTVFGDLPRPRFSTQI